MGSRRKARESALQVLYHLDFDFIPPEKALLLYWKERKPTSEMKEYTDWIVTGVIKHLKKTDETIQSFSKKWLISRMSAVDRNILRIAVFEMIYGPGIAAAIIIDEAIEIAKKYGNEHSSQFINGILDSVNKNIKGIKSDLKEKNDDGIKK